MKACVTKTALLALIAGFALSANAKPVETRSLESAVAVDHQNGDLMVVARRGFAGTTLGPKKDVPISVATPTGT